VEASNLYVGDYVSYLDWECHEITLDDSECINDFTTFYFFGFVMGFGYNTTLGNSGIVTPKSSNYGITTWDDVYSGGWGWESIRSPMGNARTGNSTTNDTQTCLTSIGIAE
jgi:hypothetical protein